MYILKIFTNKYNKPPKDGFYNEGGNVIWLILVAVALLGALTVQLSRTGSTTEKSGDREKKTIKTSQLLRYTASIDQAIKNLQFRDCSENDISFANSTDTNYANASSPADESCHVFATNGAGLLWRSFSGEILNTGASMAIMNDIAVFGQNYGTADTRPELMLAIPVSQAVCLNINDHYDLSAVTADITADIDNWDGYFTGSFPATAAWEFGDTATEAPAMLGANSGCVIDDNGQHVFYHVLLTR